MKIRLVYGLSVLLVVASGLSCMRRDSRPGAALSTSPPKVPFNSNVLQTLAKFNRAAGLLEQYKYLEAARLYEQVLQKAPGWTAARFNLGLAYFNLMEKSSPDKVNYLDRARSAFLKVLQTDANHLPARFCLGLYYQHLGDYKSALEYFQSVYARDNHDPYVIYKLAETCLRLKRNSEGTALLKQVIDIDPGFISAVYQLAIQYQRSRQREKAVELFKRFRKLKQKELNGGSYTVLKAYGTIGKYYRALGADNLPLSRPLSKPLARILFSPEITTLPVQVESSAYADSLIKLAGMTAGDIDGDGDLDICLAGIGPHAAVQVLLQDKPGHFKPGQTLDEQGIFPCLGDIDNDGDLDLWLGRAGKDSLYLNDAAGKFTRDKGLAVTGDKNFTIVARLLDMDSDGDLDFLAIRQAKSVIPADGSGKPAVFSLYNNNRDGTVQDLAGEMGLALQQIAVAAVVCDDFDNDRDQDLIILAGDDSKPVCWVNDRVGAYHILTAQATGLDVQQVVSAISGDPDKDGARDLLVFTRKGIRLFVNQGRFIFREQTGFAPPEALRGATGGQFVDLDDDGDLDIIIADSLRPDGAHGPRLLINDWPRKRFLDYRRLDPGNLLTAIHFPGPAVCIAADFTGNLKCDVLLAPTGQNPILLKNITAGGHALQLDLRGTRTKDSKSRSNNSAVGARVEVMTGDIFQQFVVGTNSGPTGLPPYRIHAGLGAYSKVDWLRILWPDTVLQAEIELPADQTVTITELQRKTSSCPHLFAWNGHHFAFISDFGGMGGLGYLVAPGQYAPPDSTEYILIPSLQPRDGEYLLQVLEPLEETVYFDEAQLIAVDHPVGSRVYPNEMMAVNAEPPSYEVFCFNKTIEPVRVLDHRGVDVTDRLRRIDRRYAGATRVDNRFMGFADEHYIELDFGDRLGQLRPDQRLVLFLYGWVEYGYSSTNYAASQAGMILHAPSIAVWRQGHWEELFHEVGYPAGINHMMSLEVTGKILPGDRRIRISSNMELYWDRVFLATLMDASLLQQQAIAVQAADLHYRGYPREYSPDGALPDLLDYDKIDRAIAWKIMPGNYTRFGDVTELLDKPDDRYVILGRGEEITLRFAAQEFAPVPPGYTRSFILKTDSFCKDMDLYTAQPDSVGPLPFHAMSGYPYPPSEHYPDDRSHRRYQREYNTRVLRDR